MGSSDETSCSAEMTHYTSILTRAVCLFTEAAVVGSIMTRVTLI